MKRRSNILNNKVHHQYISLIFTLLATGLLQSCKKFIDVPAPTTSVNTKIVYADDNRASSVLSNLFATISDSNSQNDGGLGSISILSDLSADNLTLLGNTTPIFTQYYQNAISPQYDPSLLQGKSSVWQKTYPIIYIANAAIEGLIESTTLTPALKQRLLGESRFVRAFCYFYLVNLYGDVPLVLTTDYLVNSHIARSSTSRIYEQMIVDLTEATVLLTDDYVGSNAITSSTERLRPNRQAANALLSRVQLYAKDYSKAEAAATLVINNTALYSINIPLNSVFQKSSIETIFALQPVLVSLNTFEGNLFILPATGPDNSSHPLYLSSSLMTNFENQDQRKNSWTDSVTVGTNTYNYATKYKTIAGTNSISEYLVVLRLAEQYLNRAEARNEQGNLSGALSDLNEVRNRAGLSSIVNSDQITMRTLLLRERRSEFFTEWGNRWLDLKRTGTVNDTMTIALPLKSGSQWSETKTLYPLPQVDLLNNSQLIQNQGYSN
jgi:hypothetical protein